MHDPVRHVVIDANILSAYLHPNSVKSAQLQGRSRILLEAAITASWPGLRLYTPSICIAESLGVLDKYRFCTWHGPLKSDLSSQLSADDYESSRDLLAKVVKERVVEQLAHDHGHVLLTGLVSPINNHYQIRRRDRRTGKMTARVKPPMGAADCLIAAMTIHLANRLGRDTVFLVTADQRLADVVTKASSMNGTTATRLGLTEAAKQVGLKWSPDLYPNAVNLNRANDGELQAAFGGWPLPTSKLKHKTRKELTETESDRLIDVWLEVAREHRVTNPDRLPYSTTLEQIRTQFAVLTSVYLTSDDVFWHLITKRKASKLPKPVIK